MKTPVTIELTFTEASDIQAAVETGRMVPAARRALERLLRGYIIERGRRMKMERRALAGSAVTTEP